MKKSGIYILSMGLIGCCALDMPTKVEAANKAANKTKVTNSSTDEELQAKIKAKKDGILKKFAELKKSSGNTTVANSQSKPTAVTKLGSKPRQLFSFTRLLDYSPHPTTENILKDKPVLYNGNNYYFTVTYKEDWKDVSADSACLNSICFNINVFENGKKVRDLTTPKVPLKSKNIKKGQTIGIADIAPFKFNIKVDDVTVTKKGVTVLVFKLDLIG